jgi:gluconolactonase
MLFPALAAAFSLALSSPPEIVRLDPAIEAIVSQNARLEKVVDGIRFAEGPVWDRRGGGRLLFSDLPNNAVMQWSPGRSTSEVFRSQVFKGDFPDGVLIGTNGLAFDPQGRLVAAEHGNRRITRMEKDGKITVLADRYDGKRLNSPNDVVVRSNGDIYFTDPTGLHRSFPDGSDKPPLELGYNGVYRITPGGAVELLTRALPFPNGLAFSPDETRLYVSNSRPRRYWAAFDVRADGRIANGRTLADVTGEPGDGVPDGLKVDRRGNIYAASTGVRIFSPDGTHLGTIATPEAAANCAWGDADGRTLYVTARTGVYRIRLRVAGAGLGGGDARGGGGEEARGSSESSTAAEPGP